MCVRVCAPVCHGVYERVCLQGSADVCDSRRQSVPGPVHVIRSRGNGRRN